MSYEEALAALNTIHEAIENGEVSIDQLEVKVKEAGELINYCKSKLRGTEKDLSNLFENKSE